MFKQLILYKKIIKSFFLIALLLPVSGCMGLAMMIAPPTPTGSAGKKVKPEPRNTFDTSIANHAGQDIYIESMKFDGEEVKGARGFRYCTWKWSVNETGRIIKLPLKTSLPKKIEVVWDPLNGEQFRKATLELPENNYMENYIKDHKGGYLYADIREDNNVWLRFTQVEGRIENPKYVFIVDKDKAEPNGQVESLTAEIRKAKQEAIDKAKAYRIDLEKRREKQIKEVEKLTKELKKLQKDQEPGHVNKRELIRKEQRLEYAERTLDDLLDDVECWSEQQKLDYISKIAHFPASMIVFDRWYSGAPENNQRSDK
ncbi:hypothetical protein [Kangiella shandongensis]|uniref:hypothetical protein n=1 Tax=Kangiella shandongensis TaxID=2763258 RepID=UPI001CC08880|nr:hypothetical protein [Kangiella shandongensis]